MVVPFLQNSTFTGLVSTLNYGTSLNWYNAYTTVTTNSASLSGVYLKSPDNTLWKIVVTNAGILSAINV
jgi:hypothetical protein